MNTLPPLPYLTILMWIAMAIILIPHLTPPQTPTPSHKPKYGHVCRARWRAVGWKRERLEEGVLTEERKRLEKAIKKNKRTDGQKLVKATINKERCTENRERKRNGFTSGGMSFLLISCNRTSGIRRGGCSRQSQ